jgi:hypothetical protein
MPFSWLPWALAARRSALSKSLAEPNEVAAASTRPGSRVVISCSSQTLPWGSLNSTRERYATSSIMSTPATPASLVSSILRTGLVPMLPPGLCGDIRRVSQTTPEQIAGQETVRAQSGRASTVYQDLAARISRSQLGPLWWQIRCVEGKRSVLCAR